MLWGQGDWLDFNSKPQDTFSMDGNVLSGHIGVDYQRGGLLLGLALGHSSGEVDYVDSVGGSRSRGTVDSELLSVYPYIHYSPDGAGVEAAWAMVGFGVGEAEVQREGQANPLKTDIEMRMFGWGLRTGVYAEGGVDLGAEGRWLLRADGVGRGGDTLPSVDSDAVRGRLAVELGHHLEQAGGALDTSLEVAARADAGDAEEGVGGEVGIGLGYTSLLGLDIEVRGRYLVAHSEEDFDEWGASVMVRYDLTRAGGQGFTFRAGAGLGGCEQPCGYAVGGYTCAGRWTAGCAQPGPPGLADGLRPAGAGRVADAVQRAQPGGAGVAPGAPGGAPGPAWCGYPGAAGAFR